MFLRVRQVDGFGEAAHEADDTFIKCERDGTTARFFQAARGHEVIAASVVISQVNRAYLGFHRLADISDQNIQRLVQARRAGNLLDYFA